MTATSLENRSDEDLMELCTMGNAMAFEILFLRHSGRVLGFLRKRLGSSKDPQDVLQEVFFKLHRSKHLYNSSLPFSPWLFTITRSVLLDAVKRKNKEDSMPNHEIETLIESKQDTDPNQSRSGPDHPLQSLKELPTLQAKAIHLRFTDDASFDEIARKLSTSPENARQLVSRGLNRLRKLFASGQGDYK